MTNREIAQLLRNIAAAYEVLGENRFRIIAYDRAAESIEHLTSELKDYWDDGKLGEIPAVGETIAGHLDELFKTGSSKHFASVMGKVPQAIFPLLMVPGLGPKKAYKLVKALKLTSAKSVIEDLGKAAKAHRIASIEGFGEKSESDILTGLEAFKKGQIKENRMVLPEADAIAHEVLTHIRKSPDAKHTDTLGSLRRWVSTVGDVDIAVATAKPKEVIDHFITFPHQKIIERGPTGASLLLHNGRQVDMRVGKPSAYGAMLQYFTGSKNHNIRLREYALTKGMSLNEYGIKDIRTGKLRTFETEEAFYKALGLAFIPPEIREDKGEIEAALRSAQGKPGGLPNLVELKDIRGDLHIHTSYNLEPSHDLGSSTLAEVLDKAHELGYSYVGLSDHNPSKGNHSDNQIIDIMKRRKNKYEQQYYSWNARVKKRVHLVIMLEVDILSDGKLALPDEAYNYVDAVIVSVHSSFSQNKSDMTKRITNALQSHPKVRIFGHPTGRLLQKREGYELEWDTIFDICQHNDIALEINAFPDRLDLPDMLVFEAAKKDIKFCINTDAHAAGQMDSMKFGVSVARRGWATKRDIVNCMDYNDFATWITKRR